MAVSTLDKCSLVLLKHWGIGYAVALKKRKEKEQRGERKRREERKGGEEREEKDISLVPQTPHSLTFLPKVPFASRKSNPSVYKASFWEEEEEVVTVSPISSLSPRTQSPVCHVPNSAPQNIQNPPPFIYFLAIPAANYTCRGNPSSGARLHTSLVKCVYTRVDFFFFFLFLYPRRGSTQPG